MEIIKTRKEYHTTEWEEVAAALKLMAKGEAQTVINPLDQITVQHDKYGEITLDVIGRDSDMPAGEVSRVGTLTLQFHDLILPELPFDEHNINDWETSFIRAWLNSSEFIGGFEPGFRDLLKKVKKDTDGNRTEDVFFLLSRGEIGDTGDLYARYLYYRSGLKSKRIKSIETGMSMEHWLRSANIGSRCGAWAVSLSGCTKPCSSQSALRCAPACVIA